MINIKIAVNNLEPVLELSKGYPYKSSAYISHCQCSRLAPN